MPVSDESIDTGEQAVLERALMHSQIATALAAPDGQITWANAAMCSLVDRTETAVLSGSWREITHPDDVVNDEILLAEIVNGERESYRLRKRFCRPDGTEVPASLTVTCLRDSEGTVRTYLGQVVSVADEMALHRELMRSRDRMGAAVEAGMDPMVICDAVRDGEGRIADLRIAAASQGVDAFAHRSRSGLIGGPLELLFPGLRQTGWWSTLTEVVQQGEPVHVPLVQATMLFHSEPRWLEYQAARIDDGLALTWRDITSAYEATQAEVRKANEQYRLMIDNSGDVVFHTVKGVLQWVSPSSKDVLGWPAEQLLGHGTTQFWHPDDLQAAVELRDSVYAGRRGQATLRWRRPDNSYIWVEAVMRPLAEPDGGTGAVGSLRDVNDRMNTQLELNRLLGHDALTGLGNMSALVHELANLQPRPDGFAAWPALICVGVDRLSLVNDAYGHSAGDHVLAVVAARLAEELNDVRSLWRGAGVDFYVIAPPEPDLAAVGLLADRLRLAVKGPITVAGRDVDVTASVGVALDREGRRPEDLIQAASLATSRAKDSGRDRVSFEEPELTTIAQRHIEVLELARDGLSTGTFVAHFMPIVSLRTGVVVGFEALSRWQAAEAMNDPTEFIPILESSSLICELDLEMIRQALEVLDQLPEGLFVSANVSARTLEVPGCAQEIIANVSAHISESHPVHLEITETSLMPAAVKVSGPMCALSDIGVRWYVDDFGMGFSSISHIRDLPISGLKLDKSFTAGIGRGDETSLRLAQAMAGLAQGLELDTVAEGVAMQQEAASLRAQGWKHGQGWLYGAAVGADHLADYLGKPLSAG